MDHTDPHEVMAFPRQFARTRRFSLGVPGSFTVSPDGERVLFTRTTGGEDPVGRLWLWQDGHERMPADPESLGAAAGEEEVPEEERTRRERGRPGAGGVVAYDTDAAVRRAVLALDGRLWTVDLAADGGGPRQVATPGPVVDPRLDPTGRRVAYVSGGALHVVELDGGDEDGDGGKGGAGDRGLAAPEKPGVTYGLAEHVAAEEMGRMRGHWWAPDGRRLLAARVDTTPVRRWWIADPAHPDREPRQVPYPPAGTPNAEVTLHVLEVGGGRREVVWDRAAFEYLVAVVWDGHGPLLVVQSRDQRTLRLLAADPETGATRVLREERDPYWVEIVPGVPVRTASGALVWTSDSDGARRLVVDGRPVTPDGLQVREVLGTDGEQVLFTASDEQTEIHLWSYAPEHGPVRISEEPGLHTGTAAGGTVVHAAHTERGHEVRVLRAGAAVGSIGCRGADPVVVPRVTWLRAGPHEVRTALLLPSWHEPGARRLPVLMAPYGGPAAQLVLRARHAFLCEAQWFADRGFAVVIADGRGTRGRGPAWERTVYGDKFTLVLEDQLTALRAAAEHCADLDLGRVAIRGWSFGGSLAVMALLRHPEVFRAGVAGAPATDQRLYDTHWSERFLGHPDVEPENYDRSSPLTEAAGLSRPLLLVHGLADDNVAVAHTLRLSAALLAAGRPHRVLPLSGATHRPSDEVTVAGMLRHQLDFLRETLGLGEGGPDRVGGGPDGPAESEHKIPGNV